MQIPKETSMDQDGDDRSEFSEMDEEQSRSRSEGGSSTEDGDNKYFGKAESRKVQNLKAFVLLILLCVTIAVCFAVYDLTSKGQQTEFEGIFIGNADKVFLSFQDILKQKIAAIASLSVSFTAFAKAKDATWPLVTMNDFQQRAASAKSLSDAYFLELLPIVSDEGREEWETYSVANKAWLQEGREHQKRFGLGTRHLELNEGDQVTGDVVLDFTQGDSSISEKIFTFDETWATVSDPGPGPYYPIWQSSPVLPEPRDLVNYNVIHYADYGPFINLVAKSGQIAIGGLDVAAEGDITHPDLATSFFAYLLSFAAGELTSYEGDPMSSVYIPVVDSFDEDRKTVAVLLAVINWATYFKNALPKTAQPVAVVLENTCDGKFTYEVAGDGVRFLGQGNLANPKYDDMKLEIELDSNFVAEATTIALTLNQDLCRYLLTVYPTEEMERYYNDRFPMYITIVIAAVFLFTTLAFLLYDRMVEHRQNLVLDTAKRSTAIVSSIFPKNVRDKLLAAPIQGNATKLRSMFNTGSDVTKLKEAEMEGDVVSSGPIADLFPECTVMFADVEGFTAWSSIREPSQVFTLLETLYRAYDKAAARIVCSKWRPLVTATWPLRGFLIRIRTMP